MFIFVLTSVFGALEICTSAGLPLTSAVTKCDPGMYYDPAIGRCDTCNVICEFADIQGTTDECRDKCPDYKSQTSAAQTEVQRRPTTASYMSSGMLNHDSAISSSSYPSESHTIILLIISLCAVAVVLSAVIIMLVVWKIRGDISYRGQIHRLTNLASPPIYKKSHFVTLNGDSCVKNSLLSQDNIDI